jgi:antitoxin component of MazEF toxin-antitoxin module
MKLQKQLSRKIGNTEYAKYVTVIPPQTIKDLGWEDGDDLEPKIENGKLIIKKKKRN